MRSTSTKTIVASSILGLVLTLVVTLTVVSLGPTGGWLSAFGIAFGIAAYGAMAANILTALRRPFVERIFGPP